MRLSCFCFVRKPRSSLFFFDFQVAYYGHQSKSPIVVNPRTWLVSLLKTYKFISVILICPAIAHFVRLGSPKMHTPRHRYCGICVAIRKTKLGIGAHQRVYVLGIRSFGYNRCIILLLRWFVFWSRRGASKQTP